MCKRFFSKKISVIFLLTFLSTPAYAEEFIISSSQESVEKGEIFDLYLEIRTDEIAIENLKIDHQFPRGFTLKSGPNPKFLGKEIVNPGSSITISYTVSAPPHKLNPFTGERGISTRDRKRFIFNISYTRKPKGLIRQRQIEYFLRYTTSMYIYLYLGHDRSVSCSYNKERCQKQV